MGSLRKITIATGAVLLVLAAGVVYIALWTGSTKEIEAVADKFQPGESWTLVSERIEPPRKVCLNGGTCPELSRTWKRDQKLTPEELENMLSRAGWRFPVNGDCEINSSMSGSSNLCGAKGDAENYEVNLRYGSPDIKNINPSLSILLTKKI